MPLPALVIETGEHPGGERKHVLRNVARHAHPSTGLATKECVEWKHPRELFTMQETDSQGAGPMVRLEDLPKYQMRTVWVAGRVTDAPAPSSMKLVDASNHTVSVSRPDNSQILVDVGTHVLVCGTVNQDNTISENAAHPTTILGDDYDLTLHNDAAVALQSASFAGVFGP